jgi:hypothetical protein
MGCSIANQPLPSLGAARTYRAGYTDLDWQDAAAKWMDPVSILVIIPGLTEGGPSRPSGHMAKLPCSCRPVSSGRVSLAVNGASERVSFSGRRFVNSGSRARRR